ncbi:Spc98 family-domain-containing protein [Gloeopeniophorella convolvens]|nr:Spc98 family-domain-containing protein [Gloeopeniophorella convolvens]
MQAWNDHPTLLGSPNLPPLGGESEDLKDDLLPVRPRFFIPRLQDKPQDPIMDTLRIEQEARTSRLEQLPPELVNLAEMQAQIIVGDSPKEDPDAFWQHAAKAEVRVQSQIRSWDSLRPSYSQVVSPGPFLSEQSDGTFAAARYYVNPRLEDPSLHVLHVSMRQLFASIQNVLVGNSSSLYRWDALSETFSLPFVEGKTTVIVVDGKDETLMNSYVQRFLTIGSLLRRLDIYAAGLRRRPVMESRSVHSFAHGLATCVENIRLQLSRFPEPTSAHPSFKPSALFLGHEGVEQVLGAIASLCTRSLDLKPSDYPPFASQPNLLLSTIYTALNTHFVKSSPHVVRATLAYIFSMASNDYFQTLSRSVGYQRKFTTNHANTTFKPPELEARDEDDRENNESDSDDDAEEFPSFISSDVAETLTRARKSLKLLSTAQPDHPLLRESLSRREISWFWTADEVATVWEKGGLDQQLSKSTGDTERPASPADSVTSDTSSNPDADVLRQFDVFSLEPGSHTDPSAEARSALQSFLATFPEYLPSLTPTLTHLSNVVLSPLVTHCTAVSGALISLLLSPDSHLHLHSHLVLLRSYLLLTLPAFTMRLQAALFSDSDDWNFEGSTVRAMAKSMHGKGRTTPGGSSSQWAVGLGLGLAERDSWPPGGSDLSYYLRTVIVDSLGSLFRHADDDSLDLSDQTKEGQSRIFVEAEFRLGFAIRDLPVGSGRERWLNPSSIEALDFLFMDYKPPPPLDVIITPDVLSKYQRAFSFILRLLRVQNALAALFRMTRESPLFPTLAAANKLLLRFRFSVQSFIYAVASHVPDVAVRGNVDPFLARLTPDMFTDVFELADAHSDMMDDVLSACLLRSSQKVAGDALRGCMEVGLELCILAGERRRGRIEEYAAIPLLEGLHASFEEKMGTLIKALREQVEKMSASSHLPLEYTHLAAGTAGKRMPTGGASSLHHLLVKLDPGFDQQKTSALFHPV